MTAFGELSPAWQQRLELAAEWRLRCARDPALELSAEYCAWVSDDENRRAQAAVEESWAALGDLSNLPALVEMRRAALSRAQLSRTNRAHPRRTLVGVAAALLLLGVVTTTAYLQEFAAPVYRTDVGERRVVALPDGSRISLDSDTAVRVAYSKSARTLMLDRGRARFDVAHDVSRPFTVSAGTETVVAVGTSFDVEKLGPTVVVTLIQGHVVIKHAPVQASAAANRSVSLSAGEEFVAPGGAKPTVAPANLQVANAWEAGHLVFKDDTLADAVARVNRYSDHPVLLDPSVASIRISGVFNAGDIGSFVSAVTSYFPVQATTTGENSILLQRRS